MFQRDTFIHLVSGGIAGTAGAVVTCPLEVVKTRLQSSNPTFGKGPFPAPPGKTLGSTSTYNAVANGRRPGARNLSTCVSCGRSAQILSVAHHSNPPPPAPATPRIGLGECLRLIYQKEGPQALFKGLGPNLVGVAPSRAIYFCSYSQAKKTFNQIFPSEAPIVHICSAATAGFVACTATNPVWFVKTRLQLDQQHKLSTMETIRRIYAQTGILGFYKGITASYMGISETVIHFVIYEAVKKRLQEWSMSHRTLADEEYDRDNKTFTDFVQFMAAGAISKTTASCIAYPHEVARTRLREEGSKYRSLFQTLALVVKEEGYRGLYRGLVTQLIRQIPNTAIMMSTYEASVYLLNKYIPDAHKSSEAELTGPEALNRLPGEDYDDTYSYEVSNAHPQLSHSHHHHHHNHHHHRNQNAETSQLT